MPAIAPSQDLPGLMDGASLRRPNARPAKYAAMSATQNRHRSHQHRWSGGAQVVEREPARAKQPERQHTSSGTRPVCAQTPGRFKEPEERRGKACCDQQRLGNPARRQDGDNRQTRDRNGDDLRQARKRARYQPAPFRISDEKQQE